MSAQDDFFNFSQSSTLRSMVFLTCGALIGLILAGYALFTSKGTRSHGVPAEAVALVNQRPILRSDWMTQAQTEYTKPFAQISLAQRQKVLDDMIDEELLMQRGLEIDLPSFDPEVRNALVAGVELEVTAGVLAEPPTPQELRTFYERHKDQYSSEGVMQLRDLLIKISTTLSMVDARRLASEAAAAVRHGRPPDDVIKRYELVDSGRFVAAGHADLGDMYQFAVRAKVDDALYNALSPLASGEISDPIVEDDGVHLILMMKHRFPVPQTFEQATNRVWLDVKNEAKTRVRAANLSYLRSRADIVVANKLLP